MQGSLIVAAGGGIPLSQHPMFFIVFPVSSSSSPVSSVNAFSLRLILRAHKLVLTCPKMFLLDILKSSNHTSNIYACFTVIHSGVRSTRAQRSRAAGMLRDFFFFPSLIIGMFPTGIFFSFFVSWLNVRIVKIMKSRLMHVGENYQETGSYIFAPLLISLTVFVM